MSFQALEWARKLPIPPTPKFLMMVIASYTDTDDACFPALTTLADDTRQSVDSVRRQVTKLQGAGLLKRYPRWNTGKDAFAVGAPGDECPKGCRRTSDKIQLLLKADLGIADTYFDPDKAADADPPVADCKGPPVADCEGDGSNLGATTPVAAMVLPQEDSLEPSLEPSIERETRACEGKRPSLKRFLLSWPTAAIDDKSKTERAWNALPDEDCEPALVGIERFIAELKKHGRKHIPAGWKYLEDQSWKLIDRPGGQNPTSVQFDCWSKDWWALLVTKIERNEKTGFMVKYASEPGRRAWGGTVAEMPTAERIAEFKNHPSDGPVMAAWRPWFESKGVKLPQWDQRVWVFLPSTDPPNTS